MTAHGVVWALLLLMTCAGPCLVKDEECAGSEIPSLSADEHTLELILACEAATTKSAGSPAGARIPPTPRDVAAWLALLRRCERAEPWTRAIADCVRTRRPAWIGVVEIRI